MNMILFETLPEDSLIPASDERARHILEVLKLQKGDTFRMGVINQSEGDAEITGISEEGIVFSYN